MFTIEHCKTTRAYKVKYRQPLDIMRINETEHVLMDAGPALVIRISDTDVVVHGYGELLIKTGDEHVAKQIATHLETYLESSTPA